MKKIAKLLLCLLLCAMVLPACLTRAEASDLDYIDYCHMTVQPSAEDGSLLITAAFRWTVLDQGPVNWLQIGIPNGSIRETTILTGNIAELSYDNSFMRVDFAGGYNTGETFEFSYSWVQEYMYALGEDGSVSFTYTPGWFDEAEMGEMTITWIDPAGAVGEFLPDYGALDGGQSTFSDGGCVMTAQNLPHGARLTLTASYAQWPVSLGAEGSIDNLPSDDYGSYDGNYDGYYESGDDGGVMSVFIVIFIIVVVIILANVSDGYNGGFGNTYIFYNGLWYPRGPGGKPRPGSTGLAHKPAPPSRPGGGFGGGSRGGGFGGGGFGGGGGHCACASSCACACACACAGGGRAGCSAKNLYGAVRLSRGLTSRLSDGEAQE